MTVIIRRILIVAILLGGLAFGVTKFMAWRTETIHEQLNAYQADLNDPNPQRRLNAAEGLLDDKPTPALRMIRVEALIALNRHPEARKELQYILDNKPSDPRKVQILQIESYLAEARIDLLAIDTREPAQSLEGIEELMRSVDARLGTILGDEDNRLTKTFNLRRLDVLARTLHTVLATKRIELTVASESGVNESIQVLGIEVQTLEKRLKEIDAELLAACESVLSNDPNNADATEMNFAYSLRHGDTAKARQQAQHLAGLPSIDAGVAGRVADTLLTLEVGHGIHVTDKEIALADRLLTHPNMTGTKTLQFRFAAIRLALDQGKAVEAEKLAKETLPRAPTHPRLRCELAMAYIALGKPDDAVASLQKLGDTTNLAECQYVLGLAYLARGDQSVTLGMDYLRRCVELRPEHLPARMKLVEAMVQLGYTREAYLDIEFARKLNPSHPRVRAQAAKIAVMAEDMGRLSTIVAEELALVDATPSAEDHLLVAAMLLDDIQTVRQITMSEKRLNAMNVVDLVAKPWLTVPAARRVPIACAIGRGMLDEIDSDPMMRAAPVGGPVVGAILNDPEKPSKKLIDPLAGLRYVEGPAELARHIAERGLDAWQHDARLIQVLIESLIWSNQPKRAEANLRRLPPAADGPSITLAIVRSYINNDDESLQQKLAQAAETEGFESPTVDLIRLSSASATRDSQVVSQTLQRLLTNHPWSTEAVLLLMRQSMARNEADKAYSWLGQVQLLNPHLARLARARLNLALNKPADALTEAESMIMDESPQSELRRWSAEARAIAFAQMDQPQLAVSTFDQLMLTMKEHSLETRIYSADVLAEMGKTSGAAEILSRLLARSENPPHIVDRMLSRAIIVMKPRQMRALVDTLLSYTPNEPVLLLYQAKLTIDEDEFLAEKRFKNVMNKEPGSPRTLMEWAAFNQKIQPDESIRIYRKLAERGGSVGDAAQHQLDLMSGKNDASPETRNAPDSPESPESSEATKRNESSDAEGNTESTPANANTE